MTSSYDVIVVGGGPAGCTTATLVASAGHKVILLEREKTSQFQIGESLMPGTYWTFDRLGMLDRLRKSAFPKKHSVQFYGRSGKASSPFYFRDTNSHESSMTWQVLRSELDQMMLDNARDHGVEVVEGAMVLDVLFESDVGGDEVRGEVARAAAAGIRATGVKAKMPDGLERSFGAPVTVDATGQSALIARRLKITEVDSTLKKASIYTHLKGGRRDEGIDAGATLIMQTDEANSWFWYIPLPDDQVSVGVVGSLDYLLQDRDGGAQEIFEQELSICTAMKERIDGATQLFPVKVTKDFSYRADRIAGDGWLLVGDAFGFLDPIYSSGVYLALKSGEMAADAICDCLGTGDFTAEALGRFGPEFVTGMESVRKLVYAFYTKDFSFGEFLKRHPECREGIIDILSGDLYKDGVSRIFEPMSEMCDLPDAISLEAARR